MVKFVKSDVQEVVRQCVFKFKQHAAETNTDRFQLNTEMYFALERSGVLDVFAVVNEEEEIVGYLPAIRMTHHRQNINNVIVDCIFLDSKYRGTNIAYRFLDFVVAYYYENGNNDYINISLDKKYTRFMDSLGFFEESINFTKPLT